MNKAPPPAPDLATVDRWMKEVQVQLEALQDQLRPLLQEETRLQDRLKILKDLRSTFMLQPPSGDASGGPAVSPPPTRVVVPSRGASETTRGRVHRQVRELLEAAAGPMHINDIHRSFLERGWAVPGAGRPANITAHLTGADGFASPARGLYAIAKGDAPASSRQRKQPPRRRATTGRRASA